MISQIDLITGIMGLFIKNDKELRINSRQMNAIINAANSILAELDKPTVLATPNMGLTAWLKTDDTGSSSLWMAKVIYGQGRPDLTIPHRGNAAPQDPDDFGRCYRFLQAVPDARSHMFLVAGTSEEWSSLWGHWDELEKLWIEESLSGECPKLYERMKELTIKKESSDGQPV